MTPAPPPLPETSPTKPKQARSWVALIAGLAWIILCFELGAFLVVYPWMDSWESNLFASLGPQWRQTWTSPWLRGAVSGLGAVNILISLVELFRYLRDWLFDGSGSTVG